LAEGVAAAIGIVGREDDEAFFGEAGGEVFVVTKSIGIRICVD